MAVEIGTEAGDEATFETDSALADDGLTRDGGTADAGLSHTENTADADDEVAYVEADATYQETIWSDYAQSLATAAAAAGLSPNVQALDSYFSALAGDMEQETTADENALITEATDDTGADVVLEDEVESAAVDLANEAADAAEAETDTTAADEAATVSAAVDLEATAVSEDGVDQAGFISTAADAEATFEVGKAGATRDYDNAVAQAGVDYVATLAPEEKDWFLGYVDPIVFGYGPDIDTATQDALGTYNTAVANANVTRV
ncbi:MAG TPA: hypothetical protein VFX03_10725, partial [Thermomicrobiales bacterium]|nr:hypothetical protein [Thermomicrobiales bacterium]